MNLFNGRRLLLFVGLLAAISVALLITSGGPSSSSSVARSAKPDFAHIRPVSESLRRNFGLFRKPAERTAHTATASKVPALMTEMTQSQEAPSFMVGTAAANIQSITTNVSGTSPSASAGQSGTVWVAPGPGGVCVAATVLEGAGTRTVGTCNTTAAAETSGVGGAIYNSAGAQTFAYGIVPNGQVTADLRTASGKSATVPVRDNVYMVWLPKQFKNAKLVAHR